MVLIVETSKYIVPADIKKILSPNWILKSIIFPAIIGPERLEISKIIIKDALAAIKRSPL